MMSSSNFNEASHFVTFFGHEKRLQLLQSFLSHIHELEQRLQRSLNILDIGAGIGMHANYFANRGHQVTAVDPEEEMLAQGKQNYPSENLHWVIDSLPTLAAISSQRFDVIYSIAAWQYISPENRQEAMKQIIKLLLPGGFFAIIWPSPASRENQYPLSTEMLLDDIQTVNKTLSEDQLIKVTHCEKILDPDKRKGFIEKTQDVYFYTLLGELPAVELQNTLQWKLK